MLLEELLLSHCSKLSVFLANPPNLRTLELVSPFCKTVLRFLYLLEMREREVAPGQRPLAQLSPNQKGPWFAVVSAARKARGQNKENRTWEA